MKNEDKRELAKWQERLERNLNAYGEELQRMDARERQYDGEREISPTTENDRLQDGKRRRTAHVWNITAENIDAIVDSTIPMPKVVPLWKKDEKLARKIENMLRNEIERLPMESINDRAERVTKKQGGAGLLTEWDAEKRTHTTVGENCLRVLHPKRIVPQDGVQDLDEMDYYFVRVPMTRSAVKRRYNVDVTHEKEAAPELRTSGSADDAEDMVTVEIAVYRNDDGGIGRFAWVGDTVCESLPDCQTRRLRRCKKCGMSETDGAMALNMPLDTDGELPEGVKARKPRKDECSFCGSRSWEYSSEEYRSVPLSDLKRLGVREDVLAKLEAQYMPQLPMMMNPAMGTTAQTNMGMMPQTGMGMMPQTGMGTMPQPDVGAELVGTPQEIGLPTQEKLPLAMPQQLGITEVEQTVQIPYYKPKLVPLVLMRNVTAENRFLGESDCDKVKDQQNTINRMEQKILDRLVKAGTKITVPPDTHIRMNAEDSETIPITAATDIALIKQFDFSGNLQYEMTHLQQVYNEAQRVMGVTESFLGRKDSTATSGTAKQFAAAQTVGRLESRRVLKKQAWGEVFERMFKNMLAYADERRPIHYQNEKGQTDYEEFIPYEFLEMDEAGELYWNTDFLFSCDDASGLAANREQMWQECTAHLQAGAYGNPQDVNALIIYWTKLEELHYPGAGNTKKLLEEQRQQQMQQQAIMMQMQQAQTAQMQQQQVPTQEAVTPEMMR